ncbi:family 20 glycosylhydrolase [Reichenbachiella agarivorans]|uniref:Family 20 glycosylhydrolase n=1 Tax=Reichenbachiella agarivorans TaxID=2979464 RepID=A0ABY6CP65_9BACT|nr:family 20 glycosylhydrolase [Reichenbachiella agarivorans]UXP32302.1 family 20 glycosylhydrolase [Reichenbachiella agarivorans]
MKKCLFFLMIFALSHLAYAQDSTIVKSIYGLSIAAPQPSGLDQFIQFMEDELGPNGINTLILRVDYNYQYQSYPQLRNEVALSKKQVKRLVKTAKSQGIELIPQINLLGHQSWAGKVENLLKEFPQFDETPHVQMPEEYVWPNADSLYCKSYCPLHPEVHDVVFAMVDEIMEVFEAKAFHAGMDEVFYIGDEKCPRCTGQNKAELYANEVTLIRNHLAANGQELWIWGDRLLEGKVSGLGMWEASINGTEPAIDMIPRDVVICDWHYDVAEPTPAIFASKGLQVIICFWNKADVSIAEMKMIDSFRVNSNKTMRPKYLGSMQTIWSNTGQFIDAYHGKSDNVSSLAQAESFRAMIDYIRTHDK